MKLEIKRQLFHIFLGLIIIFLISYNLLTKTQLFIIIILGFIISFIARKKKLPLIYWFLREFERKELVNKFPGKGLIFFLVGCFLAYSLFPKDIVLASITILTFGDSISHLVGLYLAKKRKIKKGIKLLEGTIAGIAAATLFSTMFVSFQQSLIASSIAMIVENIEIKHKIGTVDDNIVVPLIAAVTLWILRLF